MNVKGSWIRNGEWINGNASGNAKDDAKKPDAVCFPVCKGDFACDDPATAGIRHVFPAEHGEMPVRSVAVRGVLHGCHGLFRDRHCRGLGRAYGGDFISVRLGRAAGLLAADSLRRLLWNCQNDREKARFRTPHCGRRAADESGAGMRERRGGPGNIAERVRGAAGHCHHAGAVQGRGGVEKGHPRNGSGRRAVRDAAGDAFDRGRGAHRRIRGEFRVCGFGRHHAADRLVHGVPPRGSCGGWGAGWRWCWADRTRSF